MKKFFALLGLTLLLAFLSGCGSAKPGVLGLKAEFVNIERDGKGGATATWQFVNPNVVSYIVSASKHKVYVNGRYVGLASTKEPAGIPARGSFTQTGLLALDKDGAAVLAAAGSSASYRVDSDFTMQLYGEIFEHHLISTSGTVKLGAK